MLKKYQFIVSQIYSLDETGTETVIISIKVVPQRRKKQVGQVSSGEKVEFVTFVGIINALGKYCTTYFI